MASLLITTESCNPLNLPSFTRSELCARPLDPADQDEVVAYQKLRYHCFVLRKGWVPADPANPGRETDRYDPFCHHLGVFHGPNLVAYLRVLPWQAEPGFMLEHDFRDLLHDYDTMNLRKAGHVELSRLVVAPPAGSSRSETAELAELLFKLVYNLGKQLGWTGYYIVLEEAWLRTLNRRFKLPFAPIGVPQTYPDGTRALAAFADCKSLERAMLESAPDKYHWYRENVVE